MGDIEEIGCPYYLSTEKVIGSHLEDFSNMTRYIYILKATNTYLV